MKIGNARRLAHKLLKNNPKRLQHTLGVVDLSIKTLFREGYKVDSDIYKNVVCSAYLHDIGYSEEINHTKFHPYDGYMYLKKLGISDNISLPVLYHTGSELLVHMFPSKFHSEVVEFFKKESIITIEQMKYISLLDSSDIRINSEGVEVSVEDRLQDIVNRYGENHYLVEHFREYCFINMIKEILINVNSK